MTAEAQVRRALVADAYGLSLVHVQSWTETYAHLVPEEALARQDVRQRELRWTEIITAGESAVWVALVDGEIVGFASSRTRPEPTEPPVDNGEIDLELGALYLLESQHGSGLGQALLDAAIGTSSALLWVAEDNPRARRFYERNGFVADGASEMHNLAGTPVKAIRMRRPRAS